MEGVRDKCERMSIEANRDLSDEEAESYGDHSSKARFARYLEVMMAHIVDKFGETQAREQQTRKRWELKNQKSIQGTKNRDGRNTNKYVVAQYTVAELVTHRSLAETRLPQEPTTWAPGQLHIRYGALHDAMTRVAC